MYTSESQFQRGFAALREALLAVLGPDPALAVPAVASGGTVRRSGPGILLSEALQVGSRPSPAAGPGRAEDSALAISSAEDEAEANRLIALVELARAGDCEAFGLLYDHYHSSVFRFVYYRVGATQLAEDITSETFFRALRSMTSFRWQGRDFGAWLMTIARNLVTDHFKSGHNRLEQNTDDMSAHDETTEGPEESVLTALTNEVLVNCLAQIATEQQECLIMRFLQGMSIAETAKALGRSEGAVKQLQLRAIRNLAKLLPDGVR